MSKKVEKVKALKGTLIIGDLEPEKKNDNLFNKDYSLGLSYLKKQGGNDYQTIQLKEQCEQQKYPNILTSLSKSQKRGQQQPQMISASKQLELTSSIQNQKRNDKQVSASTRITKKFYKDSKTSSISPLRHSQTSTLIFTNSSGDNTTTSKQENNTNKYSPSTNTQVSLPLLKSTIFTQDSTTETIQSLKQNQNSTLQGLNNDKKDSKNEEKKGISNKSTKSQMSITSIIPNPASTLSVAPLFKLQFTYVIEKGNNSQIVRNILNKREWWVEAQNSYSSYHFRWKPTSSGIKFDEVIYSPIKKQMVNHIENHNEISCKSKLYNNIKNFLKQNEVEQVTPKTFLLNIESDTYEKDLQNFIDSFFSIQQNTKLKNIWILKPDDLNRGKGISLFNTLSQLFPLLLPFGRVEQLKQLFSKICPQIVEKYEAQQQKLEILKEMEQKQSQGETLEKTYKRVRQQVSYLNQIPKVVVIQKYIENPLLIKDRKFDIRVWVLVDQDFKYYMFKEGYLRLSGEAFSLRSHSLMDKYVHLTNNAIQKHGKNYGKYENGNIISFADYNEYLKTKNYPFDAGDTIKQIKNLIKTSFNSARRKIFKKERKNTFEIFGYDFMVENDGHTYLIEINSNPCIEESNQLLAKLIPRMLNDAFRLTIDRIFYSNKVFNSCFGEYSVEGYSNFENIWENLGSLRQQSWIQQIVKEGNQPEQV